MKEEGPKCKPIRKKGGSLKNREKNHFGSLTFKIIIFYPTIF